jgi:hypothetical protein
MDCTGDTALVSGSSGLIGTADPSNNVEAQM